ncbi:hypothetical protein BV898_02324 [Hypsibius exemplaris]|uniref:Uncharacterized protein n=1 Tax=Hypsibius exemplaris TaxID=2072580 RepID=A0A1W0X996_HYPEX|nr:hypothetical protein BV898_02324 [Hypsibius exemplaris]
MHAQTRFPGGSSRRGREDNCSELGSPEGFGESSMGYAGGRVIARVFERPGSGVFAEIACGPRDCGIFAMDLSG